MRSLFLGPAPHRVSAIAARTAGIVLLTPLILLAGVLALAGLAAMTVGRQAAVRLPVARRHAALPVALRPAAAEPALGVVSRRVA